MYRDKGGRPLKFASIKELEEAIDKYFKECDEYEKVFVDRKGEEHVTYGKPYTITGLALALDTTRETLMDYEKGKHDDPEKTKEANKTFSDTIKRAKLKCQAYAENHLFTGTQVAGAIFSLKNNYGWQERIHQEHEGNLPTPILGVVNVPSNDSPTEDTDPQPED